MDIWHLAGKLNIDIIQGLRNKVLRNIESAPWYYRNSGLYRYKDLEMDTVSQAIQKLGRNHEQRLIQHVNAEVTQFFDSADPVRTFKRKKPFELERIITH